MLGGGTAQYAEDGVLCASMRPPASELELKSPPRSGHQQKEQDGDGVRDTPLPLPQPLPLPTGWQPCTLVCLALNHPAFRK